MLAGVEGDTVGVDLEGETETAMIPFSWITDAKLSLSDELLKRGAQAREARLAADAGQDARPDDTEDHEEEDA